MEEQKNENLIQFEEDQQTLLSYKMQKFVMNQLPKIAHASMKKTNHKSYQNENLQLKSANSQTFDKNINQKKVSFKKFKMTTSYISQRFVCRASSDWSNKRNTTHSQPKSNRKSLNKSRFYTPKTKIPLTYKFIKIINSHLASREVVYQDKKTTLATLNGQGILMISNGTKIKGIWNAGEPIGNLIVSRHRVSSPVGENLEESRFKHDLQLACIQATQHLHQSCKQIDIQRSESIGTWVKRAIEEGLHQSSLVQ